MQTYDVHFSFKNGESQVKKASSNDNITALNMAINRLNEEEKQSIIGIQLVEKEN